MLRGVVVFPCSLSSVPIENILKLIMSYAAVDDLKKVVHTRLPSVGFRS